MKGSIRSQLREKIFSEKAKGEVITSSDFLAFWPRTAVDQALSRMARDGELKRILPGILRYRRPTRDLICLYQLTRIR